jgi:hypothetical protein
MASSLSELSDAQRVTIPILLDSSPRIGIGVVKEVFWLPGFKLCRQACCCCTNTIPIFAAFYEPFLSFTAKLPPPLHDCRGRTRVYATHECWRVPREPTVLYRLCVEGRSIGYARPEATPTG